MTLFKAKWLPGGEIDLPPIPVKGLRELNDLDLKEANFRSLMTRHRFLSISRAVLGIVRVLAAKGPKEAKTKWDEWVVINLSNYFADWKAAFIWDENLFAASLEATREQYVLKYLEVATNEEAKVKIETLEKELAEEMKVFSKDTALSLAQRPIIKFYWRLRQAGVKAILVSGKEKEFNEDLAVKAQMMDLLSEVVSEDDIKAIQEVSKKPTTMEDLRPLSRADVEGKSASSSKPSTPPSVALEPYSEPFTAPATV